MGYGVNAPKRGLRALRARGGGWLLASDSLPCCRKARCGTLVRHRFRGLLPFCQCRRASRQKGRRDEIGSPSRFLTVAHHAAQPPLASRPPLYSWLRSLGNQTQTATPLPRRFGREHTLNKAEGCGGEGLTRGAVLTRRRRSCPSTQPVIGAEARLAEHGLLSEAREPSRRQDPTVWETFAKHPVAHPPPSTRSARLKLSSQKQNQRRFRSYLRQSSLCI